MRQLFKLSCWLSIAFVCFCLNGLQAQNQPALTNDVGLILAYQPFSITSNQAGDFTVGYGSSNWPSSFFDASYSPIKHIDVQANYTSYDKYQSLDNIAKVGIGAYYFIPTRKNKPKLISEKWGQATGFTFNCHFGYLNGTKRFKFYNNEEYVLANQSRAKYNGFVTEGGIHFTSVSSKFQLLVSNSNFKYNTIDLTDSGLIDETFWDFVEYIESHNRFSLYSIAFRYSLGIKQGSIYYNITTPVDGWGNTDFLRVELFKNRGVNFTPNFLFGINLNIDKIFPNKNWQINKVFNKQNEINE